MSMALAMEAGIASYVGGAGVGLGCDAGREAASVAAIEVAMICEPALDEQVLQEDGVWLCLATSSIRAMLSVTIPRRAVLSSLPKPPRTVTVQRRNASHGAPHYNEPTGYLFGEKASNRTRAT